MLEQRFPKAKFVRQVMTLSDELNVWLERYAHECVRTDNAWLRARYRLRCDSLVAISRHLDQVLGELETVPRLRG